jgi:hypothetical protein
MKTTNLFIKEGRVCCTDKEVPEDKCVHLPREFFATDNDYEEHYKGFIECGNRYESALQLIKDNAVLIREEDQERAICYMWHVSNTRLPLYEFTKSLKENDSYPVSVEVEIVTKGVCCSPIPPNINHHNDCDKCEGYSELKLARIVEEPVKLPFKEFKVKAGSVKIEKWNPVVDIQEEEPVEKKPEIQESMFTNPTENEVAEMVVNANRILVERDKFAMMDYIFDKTKIRFLRLKENSQVEDQEELWEECLSLIDERAREVDQHEFGLPRYEDPKDKTIKDHVMEKFTITRNKEAAG